MDRFNWLHLSDLHQGMLQQRWLWPQLEEIFLEDLGRLHELSGPWHAVLFTGDLTQQGTSKEFDGVTQTLQNVWKRMRELGSDPVLLSVPGNHDLVRPRPDHPAVKVLERWKHESRLQEQFWIEADSEYRRVISSSFKNYEEWSRQHPFPKPRISNGMLPGDFAATIVIGDMRVGVVGLNTAFLQLTGAPAKQRLAAEPQQFHAACDGHGPKWVAAHDICLLMTHHPPSWLTPDSQKALNGEIAPPERFAVHLFGHMHEGLIRSLSVGASQPWRHWQGASLFGLERWGNKRVRSHGYAAGRVELQGRERAAHLRLWPRVAVAQPSGRWKIIPDHHGADLLSDEGTPPEGVRARGATSRRPDSPARRTTSRALTSAPRSLRLLLLCTSSDLGTARERTAQYLTLSQGVAVHESDGSEDVDPDAFDAVVLLQAWWWDGGRAADVWLRAKADRRIAFLVDDTSDWPPRVLTEVAADPAIKKFRAVLSAAIVFQHPDQLPEKVGNSVGKIIEAQGSGEPSDRGLMAWERSYLEFRATAWRSGRTASGRSYLMDAEQATELYRPELYVPLDGESPRFACGKDGYPVPLKNRKERPLGPPGDQKRVRLSRWVSSVDIPRLALVGAPGGGKTVFLTRLAAALGSMCLGRLIGLEDIDPSRLRAKDGRLMIPVVVEATRVAEQDCSTYRALINAIVAECSHGVDRPPTPNDVENGLKYGRYLVLVDALDEIPNAQKRVQVLELLKSIGTPALFGATRCIVTTRSARYTGALAFGPEFEVISVASLNSTQVDAFCAKWTQHRGRNYLAELQAAVASLGDTAGETADDRSLIGNPLTLTAICMVYERHRSLPDDRAELCALLVDDLCRSRTSKDEDRNWMLGAEEKRDLLERVALSMQEAGKQAWPVSHATEVALQGIPAGDVDREARAARHVHWIAEHTGLIRFDQPEARPEEIRFWHRLFREYLAASRLARRDETVRTLMDDLWLSGRLIDPFWEDVVRLLARALGTREKAGELASRLSSLADDDAGHRGRLLGLLAAAVIESRALFPDIDAGSLARRIASVYEDQAMAWSLVDRLFLLQGLGRLDPVMGDPRLRVERWVEVIDVQRPAADGSRHVGVAAPFSIGWAPVTVQEYAAFLSAGDRNATAYWDHAPTAARATVADRSEREWKSQLRRPNAPVTDVTWYEAVAYCRWRTATRSDGNTVALTTVEQWEAAAFDVDTGKYVWDREWQEDAAFPTFCRPVGAALEVSPRGVVDLIGNSWEWCSDVVLSGPKGKRQKLRQIRGGIPREGKGVKQEALAEPVIHGHGLGFRCVLLTV